MATLADILKRLQGDGTIPRPRPPANRGAGPPPGPTGPHGGSDAPRMTTPPTGGSGSGGGNGGGNNGGGGRSQVIWTRFNQGLGVWQTQVRNPDGSVTQRQATTQEIQAVGGDPGRRPTQQQGPPGQQGQGSPNDDAIRQMIASGQAQGTDETLLLTRIAERFFNGDLGMARAAYNRLRAADQGQQGTGDPETGTGMGQGGDPEPLTDDELRDSVWTALNLSPGGRNLLFDRWLRNQDQYWDVNPMARSVMRDMQFPAMAGLFSQLVANPTEQTGVREFLNNVALGAFAGGQDSDIAGTFRHMRDNFDFLPRAGERGSAYQERQPDRWEAFFGDDSQNFLMQMIQHAAGQRVNPWFRRGTQRMVGDRMSAWLDENPHQNIFGEWADRDFNWLSGITGANPGGAQLRIGTGVEEETAPRFPVFGGGRLTMY